MRVFGFRPAEFIHRPPHFVDAGDAAARKRIGREKRQQRAQILQTFGHHMDDVLLRLHATVDPDQARAHDDGAIALEDFRPDDDVGDSGFVFQRGEDDARRGAGALAHQNKTGDGNAAPASDLRQTPGLDDRTCRKRARRNETGCAFSESDSAR